MKKEIWKEIGGTGGNYLISSYGNIISKKCGKEKLLKTRVNRGYVHCGLFINGKLKTFRLHRLIAIAFIPNIENKPFINHKNGIKNDNRIENLEWVTQSENELHKNRVLKCNNFLKYNHPLKGKFGENHPNSKKVIQYNTNGDIIKEFSAISEASRQTGIKNITICCQGIIKTAGGFIWKFNTI